MLYSTLATHSDDTIYSSTSTAGSTSDGPKLRRQKSRVGASALPYHHHSASAHRRSQSQQHQPSHSASPPSAASGRLRENNNSAKRESLHKPQHGRSVSLLGRFRHTSPSASPTSSDGSRDARSERTLAHSASSGSMRGRAGAASNGQRNGAYEGDVGRASAEHAGLVQGAEHRQAGVRVLPPHSDEYASENARTGRLARKRNSLRSDGKSGGFISQLLRGSSRSRSPHYRDEPVDTESSSIQHFVRSPETPRSHRSNGSQSPASIDDSDDPSRMGPEHFHVTQCPFVPQTETAHMAHEYDKHGEHMQPDMYCVGHDDSGNSTTGVYYAHPAPGNAVHGMVDHRHAAYGPDDWYEGANGEDAHTASRLVSSLPVYEPIDMSRAAMPYAMDGGGYARATRPVLPDARMLAPMASLADIYGAADYNTLSNRELRFAVENHMLVEQHRYLIRDLGHARSAISALKQVVQAKEERFEHYEMANVELQQRVVLLESMLTGEQRQQLACLPYTFSTSTDGQLSNVNLAEAAQCLQQPSSGSLNTRHDQSGEHSVHCPPEPVSTKHQGGGTSVQFANESDAKRHNRPLSGYATGYSFNDKPVHQLPRVFSGDFSSSEVHAMENSVEQLASAISAMPRDADSVEDIIASKPTSGGVSDSDGSESYPDEKSASRKRQSKTMSPTEPKRRSRFFSALRMSGLAASLSASAGEPVPGTAKSSKRRSVSLGNSRPQSVQPKQLPDMHVGADVQSAIPARTRADTDESLVASCPTLIPGIAKSKPLQKSQRLTSADSASSGGRYPMGLGLAPNSSNNSRLSSRQSQASQSSSTADEPVLMANERRRKISQRLSFTPQPRRSTSAPSRPHSMRVTSRRSWIFQLFGVGSGSSTHPDQMVAEEREELESASEDTADDDEILGAKIRRRRVMTQSSDEVTHFLGKLRLEEEPPQGAAGRRCVLEDLIDDIGEDDEQAAQASLSVAEIRQQTLDALNGSVRNKSSALSATNSPQHDVGPDSDSGSMDPAGSRWRRQQPDASSSPTIRKLDQALKPTISFASSPTRTSAGLGVSVSHRRPESSLVTHGSEPASDEPLASSLSGRHTLGRRSLSWAQSNNPEPARSPGHVTGDDSDSLFNSKRWAPAFWAPPPLALHPGSVISPNANTWSPRNSVESADTGSAGRRTSDDICYRSPHGSASLSAAGSQRGSGGSHRGSPWELVKIPDSRNFPISPSHSRSGSPLPSRGLAFFEDTTVPDSDELTMAARRSLSLRMSRNAFKQAEPLPESDDVPDHAAVLAADIPDIEYVRRDASEMHAHNPVLARVASTTQSKRRSLLWQFNNTKPAKLASKAYGEQTNSMNGQSSSAKHEELTGSHDTLHSSTPSSSRRTKKWWSSVLG
ncbi:hypothetical protein GGF43_000599 [Coemansia sp. RSA 2618]|nr:hypothetical protein GGF43_000599 [Coemansia sp. RSA 2618]